MAERGKRAAASGRRSFGPVRVLLILIFAAVFVFSGYMFLSTYLEGQKEQGAFDQLTQLKTEILTGAGSEEIDMSLYFPDGDYSTASAEEIAAAEERAAAEALAREQQAKLDWYSQMKEEYPDLIGWVSVPGMLIDCPVMYTPEDPDYYLHRSYDGSYARSGTPFLGEGGDENSDCTIVYGHNMKNDTMFGTLEEYKEESFGRANPVVYFDSLEEIRAYTVFAAVECRVLTETENDLRYYQYAGPLDERSFDELNDWLIDRSIYDLGAAPQFGDQIVILSTCSYHTEDGRFIVAAFRERPEETEETIQAE